MPATCALVVDGVLVGRLHERFRTSPGVFGLTLLQHGGVHIYKSRQMRAVEISLGGDPTGTPMPALTQGLFDHHPTVATL